LSIYFLGQRAPQIYTKKGQIKFHNALRNKWTIGPGGEYWKRSLHLILSSGCFFQQSTVFPKDIGALDFLRRKTHVIRFHGFARHIYIHELNDVIQP
jgi:hypothetical protein